jgi:hypothetical protein
MIAIVNGVYRSGTSVTALVLQKLGFYMGHRFIYTPKKVAPTGTLEDIEFARTHGKLYKWHGMAYNFPNVTPPQASADEYVQAYKMSIIKRGWIERWGVKDPKMCFTLPYFLTALGDKNYQIIRCVRKHDDIIRSWKTAGWYPAHCEEIVSTYEASLHKVTSDLVCPMLTIDYDELIDDPHGTVGKIATFVGLPVTAAAVDAVDKNFRRSSLTASANKVLDKHFPG